MQKMLEQKAGSLDAVLIGNGSIWSGEIHCASSEKLAQF